MPDTAYYGGFECRDKELMARIRSVGGDLVKAAGKKILSGDFNLTTISFPIRACSAMSVLQRIPDLSKLYSFYLNYAATVDDPVERMKAVLTGTIAGMYMNFRPEKPLNPVLGETFEAVGADGSKIYVEQTSHHPPVSHMYVEGPDGRYIVHGWNEYIVKAWLNSAQCKARGTRQVIFPSDG